MVYHLFGTNSTIAKIIGGAIKSDILSNQQLSDEIQKLITNRFK